jgi:hypothetical protein
MKQITKIKARSKSFQSQSGFKKTLTCQISGKKLSHASKGMVFLYAADSQLVSSLA